MNKYVLNAVLCSLLMTGCTVQGAAKDSFEEVKSGGFSSLTTSYGEWIAEDGHAEIKSGNAKTGSQSLRILGGESRSVVLVPKPGKPTYLISFWAERWTGSAPFSLRVEKFSKGSWEEIYNGDKALKTGGFHAHVRLVVNDPSAKKFRFTATSPENTGVLIDDLRISEPMKMSIVSAVTEQKKLPVLIRNEYNPLIAVKVEAEGNLQPKLLTNLRVDLTGTDDPTDIKSVSVYYAGAADPLTFDKAMFEKDILEKLTLFDGPQPPAKEIIFSGSQTLGDGINNFVVSVELNDGANLLHYVDATCTGMIMDGKRGSRSVPQAEISDVRQPIGYAVRKNGDDNSHTYRIPGMATTKKATLISVYDIRYHHWGDLPARIDVGMSRSTDGGDSWEPMQVVMDMGDHDQFRGNGIGDPAVLVDDKTGTIWIGGLWSHGNMGWHGSKPGLEPEETGQFVLVRSDDDGKTWSKPINITKQVKTPEWQLMLQGPGAGITMSNGTLVFAAQYRDCPENNGKPYSTIIYSEDHGETWKCGTGAKIDTTEAQVVELSNGSLMLNMRDNRGGSRSVYTTEDMGQTWKEHPTTRKALPESVCQASIIKHPSTGWLFFSNPNVTRGRSHITIKASKDDGMTWPEEWHLLIDEGASAGYSCLSFVDEETIGIFYEGNRAPMSFQKFRIKEVLKD